jgi:hypothetical protein
MAPQLHDIREPSLLRPSTAETKRRGMGVVRTCRVSTLFAALACSNGGPARLGSGPDAETMADADTNAGVPDASAAMVADDGGADAATSSSNPDASLLPTGTVTIGPNVPCPTQNVAPGASCQQLTVSCPGIPDIQAIVAVSQSVVSPDRTVVLHNGSGGTAFFNGQWATDGGHGAFTDAYLDAGFRVVQVLWDGVGQYPGWQWTPDGAGTLAAACRPSTFFRWAFEHIHGADRTKAYCGEGFSGGSGALSYAMAHYGLGDAFDFVMAAAGPPYGRMDYGCDHTLYDGGPRNLCSQIPDAPFAYDGVVVPGINASEGTRTCASDGGTVPASDIARWTHDSVLSPGGVYDYPKTSMRFWYCANAPNETTGQGSFYAQSITSDATIQCGGGECRGEAVYADPSNFQHMVNDMIADCTPRHADGG